MIIKHKRALDVCFEVKTFYRSTGLILGKWINLGYVKSWYLDNKDTGIVVDDFTDWMQIIDTNVTCLRYGTWVPL